MLDPHAIHIYTDGSCYKNPGGQSGCAAIVRFPESLDLPDKQILDFGCSESSINRMELMACVKALDWVRHNGPWTNVTRVQIVTDSQHVSENIGRAPTWKRRGWRNTHGELKFNPDLWDKLLKLRAKAGVRVDFVWQKGKKTGLGKRVDRAAKIAAQRGGMDVDRGYRPGSVCRSMVIGGVAQRFQAEGQVLVVRPYVKKVMRGGDNRISFNIFDEATQTYSGKFYAFAEPLLSADLHRASGHRVRFNSNANLPQFLERVEGVEIPKTQRRRAS